MLRLRRGCDLVSRRFSHLYIDHFNLNSTGITLNEFRRRREKLVDLIRREIASKHFTLCFPSAIQHYMGPDVAYLPFKQQADFYYLTGCMQPNSFLLFNGDQKTFTTHLFVSPSSMSNLDEYQRWFGPVLTDSNEICQIFGIDSVEPMEKLFSREIPSSSLICYDRTSLGNTKITEKFLQTYSSSSKTFQRLNIFLDALRSIKSVNEQNILRQVSQWTCEAFIRTMKTSSKQIDNEAVIKARFQYECEKSGVMSMAFHPVVASRGRSNILHYQKNNQPVGQEDVIMLDAGGMHQQYVSDMTRLWPVNGRFSTSSRLLYEILLTVQKELIELLNTRNRSISRRELNSIADQSMVKYLREELILSRSLDDDQAKHIVNKLCPTSVGHHLGLDVHDCESISFVEPLQSGNVITIEPGLYIPWDCSYVPSIYRGFATRIEDDILLTEDGCEILTKSCPKELDDLYQLLDQRKDTIL